MSFSRPEEHGKLVININHYVDDQVMSLDTVNYVNNLGQSFSITKFKYYIGNLSLTRSDGSIYHQDEYYLINEEEPQTKQIVLSGIPAGVYTKMSFIIGVDSIHNCTGLQEGALDPINAMFWTWNTGYIFLKLEGKAQVSRSSGRIFEYHIGGFRQPANSIRTIQLVMNKPLTITKDGYHSIAMRANAAEILRTPQNIDFSLLSSVTDAHNAGLIADNYKDMFSLISNDK